MFSAGHFFFIALSLLLTFAAIIYCRKKNPSLRSVLKVCLGLSLFSEATKILTAMEIVPVVEPVVKNGILIYQETGKYTPYLEMEHLPLELCSFQTCQGT